MDFETKVKPASRSARDVQRERVAELLEEQRRRDERVSLRRRVRGVAGWPERREGQPWGPTDP
jgi:hypothetical protein